VAAVKFKDVNDQRFLLIATPDAVIPVDGDNPVTTPTSLAVEVRTVNNDRVYA
jgi:hypothetical protein